MYILHHAPRYASLVVRLALEEPGLPYPRALVDHGRCHAAIPCGLIPALEPPQGPLFENAAIPLWLSEDHAAAARHTALAEGLGDRIFTKPSHARPPKGSAT